MLAIHNERATVTCGQFRIIVTGPGLLCSTFTAFISETSRVEYPFSFDTVEPPKIRTEADIWLLLSWHNEHLKQTLLENPLQTIAAYTPPCIVLVVITPLVPSSDTIPSRSVVGMAPQLHGDAITELFRTAGTAGICTFIGLQDSSEVFWKAVYAASAGEAFCSPSLTPWLVQTLQATSPQEGTLSFRSSGRTGSSGFPSPIPAHLWNLSECEWAVAEQAAQGLSNEEIALRLFLSINTVKSHLKQIFRKGGLTCRSQLAAQWRRR